MTTAHVDPGPAVDDALRTPDPHRLRGAWGRWTGSFVVAAVSGLVVRFWLVGGLPPAWWQDSSDYDAVGSSAVLSRGLWAGPRPPLLPLVLGATGGEPGHGLVRLQVVVAAVCWAWMAAELATWMTSRWLAVTAAAAVVGFSLTVPIVMWDVQVLTESLTCSAVAAALAATLRFARTGTAGAGASIVLAALVLAMARDTMAVAMAAAAVAVLVAGWRHRSVLVVAGSVLVVSAAAIVVAGASGRGEVPMSHLYFARVLPFPDRVFWFEAHGMPQADAFVALQSPPDGPHIVALARDDPAYAEWWDWFEDDGPSTLRAYVATHPWYLLAEPLREPERVYNNAEGSIAGYRPAGLPEVPGTTALLWPSMLTTIIGLAGGIVIARRRGSRSPLLGVAGLLAGTGAIYAAAAWHGDAMESARHVFLGGVLSRLALLVVVAHLSDRAVPGVALRQEADT